MLGRELLEDFPQLDPVERIGNRSPLVSGREMLECGVRARFALGPVVPRRGHPNVLADARARPRAKFGGDVTYPVRNHPRRIELEIRSRDVLVLMSVVIPPEVRNAVALDTGRVRALLADSRVGGGLTSIVMP